MPRIFSHIIPYGLNREILRLSIPAIVSNLTVPLLGLCDTAISGHLGSENFLAAISVGSMMLNVIFWIFGFLRMGTTGMTALSFGRKDSDEVSAVFCRSLSLALLLGVALIIFRIPLLDILIDFIGASGEARVLARSYFSICIWESPAMLATMVISGWFVGCQSTFWPMVIAVSVNVINIAVSLLLVFVAKVGFMGVAFGTLIANWIGLAIAAFAVVRFRRSVFHKGGFSYAALWCGFRALFDPYRFRDFFKVNGALFFRSACIMGVSLGVTAIGARQGALILAANAVMMQFFQLFSFFMDGFAYTAEALTGRFAGARDSMAFSMSVKLLLRWTLVVAILFTLAYSSGADSIASLLTDNADVRHCVHDYRIWVMLLPMLSAWAFIYDGFYIGVASTMKMLCTTFAAALIFLGVNFINISFHPLFLTSPDNMRLWLAFLCYLGARGIFLASWWPGVVRRIFTK